ncbi:MAG: hypothetical protein V2A54_04365 [Bacteroidota bacterium]
MICLNNQYAMVTYHENLRMLEVFWKEATSISSENYRLVLRNCLTQFEKHDIHFWFTDARNQNYVLPEDRNWVVNEIVNPILSKNPRKGAFVVSEDLLVRFNAEELARYITTKGYDFRIFTSRKDALNWFLATE